MGVEADGAGFTLQDDVTSTTLNDTTLGMYALGEQVSPGYSRYSTSPGTATWSTGSVAPSGSTFCNAGSLYSNTSGSPNTLYVCIGHTWTAVK
jgi:hypothetical protein